MISTFLLKTHCEMDLQAAMEHVIEEHAEQSGNFDKTLTITMGLYWWPFISAGNTSRRIFLKFRRARVGYTWGSRINKDSRSHWIASWTCSNSQRRLAKKSTQFVRTTAKYRGIRWWCVERFTKTDNSKAWFGYFMVHIRVRRTRTRVHRTLVYILTLMSQSS